jgi:NADH dehydrogenase
MQQGQYVARLIQARLEGRTPEPFKYWNKGNLATIGRNAAVADFGWLRLSGYFAWITWLFVHLLFLIHFENRLMVMLQWAGNYWTRNRSARLITGEDPDSMSAAPAVAPPAPVVEATSVVVEAPATRTSST